jgi:hypothetical protein
VHIFGGVPSELSEKFVVERCSRKKRLENENADKMAWHGMENPDKLTKET